MKLELTQQEAELLKHLLQTSKDDPRINGLIGTCFWFYNHTKEEEQELKKAWTTTLQKLEKIV